MIEAGEGEEARAIRAIAWMAPGKGLKIHYNEGYVPLSGRESEAYPNLMAGGGCAFVMRGCRLIQGFKKFIQIDMMGMSRRAHFHEMR